MAATGRSDRHAIDQLLFKMVRGGEVVKVGRGRYALPPSPPGEIDEKERFDAQIPEIRRENDNLTDLTDLTANVEKWVGNAP